MQNGHYDKAVKMVVAAGKYMQGLEMAVQHEGKGWRQVETMGEPIQGSCMARQLDMGILVQVEECGWEGMEGKRLVRKEGEKKKRNGRGKHGEKEEEKFL